MMTKSVEEVRKAWGDAARKRLLTEEELDSLAAGYPVVLRNNLDWAFFHLEKVLERNPHIKDGWRELVEMFRETAGPDPGVSIRKTRTGMFISSRALGDDHSFKHPEISGALRDVIDALDAIASFDPSSHMSEVIYKEAKRISQQRAADAMHDGPNGKRTAKAEIRRIWASGKYSSRDRCAEEEYAALGMSFSTARKALRGTPDPG